MSVFISSLLKYTTIWPFKTREQKIEKSVTAKVTRPPTVTAGEVIECDVFQLFGLSNPYINFETIRRHHYHRMKATSPSSKLNLPPGSTDLLRSIAETWPLNIELNVRLFTLMIIHYAVHQINTERAASQTSSNNPTSSNSSCLDPSPRAPLPFHFSLSGALLVIIRVNVYVPTLLVFCMLWSTP